MSPRTCYSCTRAPDPNCSSYRRCTWGSEAHVFPSSCCLLPIVIFSRQGRCGIQSSTERRRGTDKRERVRERGERGEPDHPSCRASRGRCLVPRMCAPHNAPAPRTSLPAHTVRSAAVPAHLVCVVLNKIPYISTVGPTPGRVIAWLEVEREIMPAVARSRNQLWTFQSMQVRDKKPGLMS